jgi:hypothetical protein
MKRASRAVGLSASMLGVLLAAGCGPSSTNDDVVTTGTPTQSAPTYSNYADYARAQNKAAAKGGAAASGKEVAKPKSG